MDIVVRKLEARSPMNVGERSALQRAFSSVRVFERGADLLSQGQTPTYVGALLTGHLCRQKSIAGGQRQIIALPLAGDIFDLHSSMLESADDDLTAITRCTVATASYSDVAALSAEHPRLAHLLTRGATVETAISREWIVNTGARDACSRVAHLFCELFVRMDDVGLTSGASYAMPLTQTDLADAAGLSVVHLNRVLQQLRDNGLISLRAKLLTIHDWAGLMRAAAFDPAYLHVLKTLWLETPAVTLVRRS